MTIRAEAANGLSFIRRVGRGGTTVVLLHGIGSNARSFEPLIGALDPGLDVLAWNAPGYADSVPLAAEWPDPSDYAAALFELLDAVGIGRMVLVGHSLGNLVGARAARERPERVAALVVVSPALGYGAPAGGPMPETVKRRIDELDRLGSARFAAQRAAGLLSDPVGRPDLLDAVRTAMAEVRRPGYDQAAHMLAAGRLLDDLAAVTVPVAVAVGSRDRVTPPDNARRAFDAAAGAPARSFHEIDGAGHAVCQEQPQAVARVIGDVLMGEAAHA
jgi:pimeloyl-ACP methyl ester carboxylesterase